MSSDRGIHRAIKTSFEVSGICDPTHPGPLLSCGLGTLTVENPCYLNYKMEVITVLTPAEITCPEHGT